MSGFIKAKDAVVGGLYVYYNDDNKPVNTIQIHSVEESGDILVCDLDTGDAYDIPASANLFVIPNTYTGA